jgi:peroxiredoxin
MKIRTAALGTIAALTLAACAAPASDPSDAMTAGPEAGSGSSANPAPSASPDASAQATEFFDPSAPDALKWFKTDLSTGETVDGTTLMHKDVVFYFWASWCPVCQAETGAIIKASESFPEDVTVIGVGGLSDVEAATGFVEEYNFDIFPNVYDEDGTIWQDFGVTRQSTLVLVNQDGQMKQYSGGYPTKTIVEYVEWLAEN